jgi:hypothetical protein
MNKYTTQSRPLHGRVVIRWIGGRLPDVGGATVQRNDLLWGSSFEDFRDCPSARLIIDEAGRRRWMCMCECVIHIGELRNKRIPFPSPVHLQSRLSCMRLRCLALGSTAQPLLRPFFILVSKQYIMPPTSFNSSKPLLHYIYVRTCWLLQCTVSIMLCTPVYIRASPTVW